MEPLFLTENHHDQTQKPSVSGVFQLLQGRTVRVYRTLLSRAFQCGGQPSTFNQLWQPTTNSGNLPPTLATRLRFLYCCLFLRIWDSESQMFHQKKQQQNFLLLTPSTGFNYEKKRSHFI